MIFSYIIFEDMIRKTINLNKELVKELEIFAKKMKEIFHPL